MSSPVVTGIDGSASALAAARWAARDARRLGAPLRLVHAYSVTGTGYSGRQLSTIQRREQGAARLHEAEIAAGWAAPGVAVTAALREGDVRAVLLDESRRARQVVLGATGAHSVSRLMMGSAGLTLAVHGDCPVVVVRDRARDNGPVVVGVDGWPDCAAAARFAFAEAAVHDTGVTVVRTWHAPGAPDTEPVHEKERASLIRQVSPLAGEFPQVPVEYIVVRGQAGHTLLDYGEHARLIVVGTHGHSGFARLLLGSTARTVTRHGSAPVAVIRSDEVVDRWLRGAGAARPQPR
ncbi:universal stress protein [Amycolatopsis alkalitolerans]|uniref:Universal stress protein n=1 Tax=Amycolatopsis alkalitolerans TaxID=2547244 RepID=A0A5C4LPF3_9PSEU|nr:universal stress protein [Amycolatopsis alkalitolerans]TNC19334.1 universal stress protein [Amycolatopsis alkalitolerans]